MRFLIALSAVVSLALAPARVLPLAGTVERIVDGDTVVLHRVGRVRLIGVDTPETKHPQKPVAQFGKESSDFLNRLALGAVVRIEYDQRTHDRHGRLLAYLYLPDGRSINAEIIRQGYGWAYTAYSFKYMNRYRALERQARVAGRGLWGRNVTR